MKIWVDAQMSPAIAGWIAATFGVEAWALRDLGLRDAEDREIFDEARKLGAAVLTKDNDFVDLQRRFGPPPKIILMTCGNTSNARLKEILTARLETAIELLNQGESIVEIRAS